MVPLREDVELAAPSSITPHPSSLRLTPSAVMPYHKLGPIDDVSQIALGTWAWGNRLLYDYTPADDDKLCQVFHHALLQGVSLFDTADSYGTGQLNARAETLLGKFLLSNPSLSSNVKIATKYASYPWRVTRQSIVDAAARSAHRLGRPADIGQIHWSTANYAPWQEKTLWDGLADAYNQGYCRSVGVSNYGPRQLRRVHAYLKKHHGLHIASLQVQVSLLSRQHVQPGSAGDVARQLGTGVIGYSPLCLGLLSGKYRNGQYPPGVRGLLFSRLAPRTLLAALDQVARTRGVTPAQVAIAWSASKNVVVLVGARTIQQVDDSIAAADITLSADEVAQLEAAAASGKQMFQNSFQTS